MTDKENVVAEKPVNRISNNKRNQVKVPKKIHKSEREKLKREQLNELFLELDHTIEPTRENNGKASIVGDAIKILRDLVVQVESLRKENATLQTETRYVTVERDELKEETDDLRTEILTLQNESRERMQANPAWNNASITDAPPAALFTTPTAPVQQQPPVVGPVYVIPLHEDFQPSQQMGVERHPDYTLPQVRRPHARYPDLSDSWPHLLSLQPSAAVETYCSEQRNSSSTSISREEDRPRPTELNLL